MLEQMNDSLRYDPGLAASRARNDQQRPIAMLKCPELFRVEQHARIREARAGIRDSGKFQIRPESYPILRIQATTFPFAPAWRSSRPGRHYAVPFEV